MTTTPSEFKRALQTKCRRQYRTRWIVLGSGFPMLLLAGIATWLVWFSSASTATEVRVNGSSLLTGRRVIDAAAVELGGSLAAQDVDTIHGRVAALAPVVKVHVEGYFPHIIEIMVTECTLAYAWMDGNAIHRVDANGVMFREGREMAQGTVKVNIAAPDQCPLKDVATMVSTVVSVLGDRITLLQASAMDRIEIQLSDGSIAVRGSVEQPQVKVQIPSVLLSQDASVHDVSAPHAPTTC